MKILLWFIILLFTLSMSHADETTPLVVWQQSRDLSVWQNGQTQTFPVGDLIFPYLSPSGDLVALVRGDYPYPQRLSVIEIDGDNLRDVAVANPRQVIWQSDDVLWVNNYLPFEMSPLGFLPSTVLYRVNLQTGAVDEWDMGEPFTMTINPSRDSLALIFAGVYDEAEGHISLLSLFGEIIPVEILRFPAISSGSHGGYYPYVQWITNTTARIAIGEPNAFYIAGDILPTTQLWEINADATSTLLGEIYTPLYPAPVWSADGGTMAYMTTSRGGMALGIASGVGELESTIVLGEPVPFFPIPQSENFLFVEQRTAMQIVGMDTDIRLWVTGGDTLVGDILLYPSGAVFALFGNGSVTLAYGSWDDNEIHEILKISKYPLFDAKWD